MNSDDIQTLEEIRDLIDEADKLLLLTLGKRFRAIGFLKKLKSATGMPTEDLKREEAVKALWKQRAQENNIPEPLALLILDFILAESKRIQSA